MGYDLLRRAELYRATGKNRELIQILHKEARHLFGSDPAINHLELEEAKLGILNGEITQPRRKTERVLQSWSSMKFASGISNALRTLGDLEIVQGNPEQALELYSAAYCIYPFENNFENLMLWRTISDIKPELDYAVLIRISEKAYQREGYFSFLDKIAVDRSDYIQKFLDRLLLRPFSLRFRQELGQGADPRQ